MTTTGRQANNPQDVKEIDMVKESISDIINQLQDIDPARLSFSPFLDLDTQISLAPVSDSPESSVEELRSSSHSVTGSQHSLVPLSADPCHQAGPSESLAKEQLDEGDEGALEGTISSPIAAAHSLEDTVENCISTPNPACSRDIPNGIDTLRWSPESNNLDSTVDEGHPLIDLPPESIEMTMWNSDGQGTCETAPLEVSDRGRCCCSCCRCCQSGRAPALCSVLASLLSTAGILYAFYFYVPIEVPDCPDMLSRLVFTLGCCAVAAIPVLLGMLMGAMCRFCTGSLGSVETLPRRLAVQQLFVTTSTEQLSLYILNLVVLATLLPQDQLRVVPVLAAMFILGRLLYWFSLHVCSSWRAFGSGFTVFPLLAMVAFNLYCLCDLGLRELLFGSEDTLFNQTTPSSWPLEMMQGGKLESGVPTDTDILDTQ
ncbi:transmembrane protein 79-like [Hypomesus transpacificus]|uniref:transmembrane protein 79-like n=1 Tax=Hypomesus transpacificus TaxID=137520 RepID=UPI001F074D96|nr:transmembrane protein 79-like [Hypomesus transpacificus]